MTTVNDSFWGLGFDPLPGDPKAIKALELDAREFGRRMIEQADFLRRVAHREGWQGEAADVFAQHVESLPRDFDNMGSAFLNLAGTIGTYHERFLLEKTKAEELEKRAVAARQKLNSAQFTYSAPAISAPGDCPPPRDRGPVDTAEDELGGILREAHGFAERFDCSPEVQGLARAIREFARCAPDEPRWHIIRRWAGDVFSATPVGSALNAAHELINHFAEFFDDLAQLLSDLSGFLGVISLPLMFLPPMGTALAISALALTAGSAAIKTSLYVGHARDENGKLYVSGGELISSYVDVGLGAVGVGIGAGAARAADAARAAKGAKAVAAAEKAARAVSPAVRAAAETEVSFGKSLAEQFSRETFQKARVAPEKLVRYAQRVGTKQAAKFYWEQNAALYARNAPGRAYNIGGLILSGGGSIRPSDPMNVAGWKAPVHLFRDDISALLSEAPDPDLQIKVQPTVGTPRSEPTPTLRPAEPPIRRVMDR